MVNLRSARDKPMVMVVDDDPRFLEIISVYLQSVGLEVSVLNSQNSLEIITNIEDVLPELVLMDVYLSAELLGIKVAERLKRNSKTQCVRIVFWTSAAFPQREANVSGQNPGKKFKEEDFWDKSEDLGVITQKIRNALKSDTARI